MWKKYTYFRLFVLVVATFCFLAACGKAGTPESAEVSNRRSTAEKTKIKISYNKNGGQTPLFVAEQYGFYEKYGLEVERIEFNNNSDMVGAMNAGQVDIIASIPSFIWNAREAGYDLVTIMQNETSQLTAPDSGALIVGSDSNIKEYKDLEGKKVAVLAVSVQNWLNAGYVLKANGVDLSKIQLVEAPFPTHFDLLQTKQVDAVTTVDPFTTHIVTSGIGEVLMYYNIESAPGQPLGAWWVTRDWLADNQETAAKFQAAIKDSIDFLNEDEHRARQIVGEFIGLDEKILENMRLLNWNYDVDRDVWEKVSEINVEMGALQEKPDPDSYFTDIIRPFTSR